MSEIIVDRNRERELRNSLFEEIATEALRVAYESSDAPYGDIPEAELISPFSARLTDPRFRLKPVFWYSRHLYEVDGVTEAAVIYEQKQKGTGYYTKLRTASVADDEVLVTDYAVKTNPPGRSINWLDMVFSAEDGSPKWRSERDNDINPFRRNRAMIREMIKSSIVGNDIESGYFDPSTPEDYITTRIRQKRVLEILRNLTPGTVLNDVIDCPEEMLPFVALPYTYSFFGPKVYNIPANSTYPN